MLHVKKYHENDITSGGYQFARWRGHQTQRGTNTLLFWSSLALAALWITHSQTIHQVSAIKRSIHTEGKLNRMRQIYLMFVIYYRSCEGYVFTGVCLSTEGGSGSVHAGIPTPSPAGAEPPRPGILPQRDGYCCGWYASYWNAFLFLSFFLVILAHSLWL